MSITQAIGLLLAGGLLAPFALGLGGRLLVRPQLRLRQWPQTRR